MFAPKTLFHKVLGGYCDESAESIAAATRSIMNVGLIPQVAGPYRELIPASVRAQPIVWLADGLFHGPGGIVTIASDYLEPEKLYHLEVSDVEWWVYQGTIPPEAIEVMRGETANT